MVVNCKLQQFQAMWCCYALKNKEGHLQIWQISPFWGFQ